MQAGGHRFETGRLHCLIARAYRRSAFSVAPADALTALMEAFWKPLDPRAVSRSVRFVGWSYPELQRRPDWIRSRMAVASRGVTATTGAKARLVIVASCALSGVAKAIRTRSRTRLKSVSPSVAALLGTCLAAPHKLAVSEAGRGGTFGWATPLSGRYPPEGRYDPDFNHSCFACVWAWEPPAPAIALACDRACFVPLPRAWRPRR